MSARPPAPVHGVFVRLAKSAIAILIVAFAALFAAPAQADDLHYFKNYFVTGDYTVAGVGLFGKGVNGLATGKITVPGIPAHADIVAAFLYWQTVETTTTPSITTGTFDGNPIVGASLGATNAAGCWSQGGTSPNAFARVYRADVLRYLPIDSTFNVRVADSMAHTVVFADSGNSLMSVTPHTEGASMVVIYRTLGVGTSPYKAVVIYDGADTEDKFTSGFSQIMGGFYQASGPGANGAVTAKMTHIVGNGQPNFSVHLTVNGNTPTGVTSTVLSGGLGSRWDNPTFNISIPANAPSLTTQVTATNNQVCLSWGAVVMSTNVKASDGDALLDIWKTKGLHLNIGNPGSPAVPATSTTPFVPAVPAVPATFGTCIDFPNDPVAKCENLPLMGAKTGEKDVFIQFDWMQGSDLHLHVPKLAALQMLATVFRSNNIFMHFDVGSHYQVGGWPFIIPTANARGGQAIPEAPLLCVPSATVTCEFPNYPVLGWKSGFDAIANGYTALNIPAYFSHDRKDIFYYALFSHALSGPFTTPPATVPYSVSGVGDAPGGDLMVSLGLWPQPDPAGCLQDDPNETTTNLCVNQSGTVLIQAGTLMHELGHNMGLRHAGLFDTPNCMPQYQSVMNYMYQTLGLTRADGSEAIDFSKGLLGSLNESSLLDSLPSGPLVYKLRFYRVPISAAEQGSLAKANCDGTLPPVGTPEIKTQTTSLQTPLWDGKAFTTTPIAMDINYDGAIGNSVFVDNNDWASLNLLQVGARSNVNGLSADVGQKDLGQKDLGQKDLGQKDLGQKDLGQKDLGQKDLGQANLGDVDYETAVATLEATGSQTPLIANVTAAVPASISTTGVNQITLSWGPPSLGSIQYYSIYRTNMSVSPAPLVAQFVGTVPALPLKVVYTFTDNITDGTLADSGSNCDPTQLCYNATYQYYITATDVRVTTSTPSNFVTATVDHLYVTAYTNSYIYNGTTLPDFSATGASYAGLPSGAISSSTPGLGCTNTNPAGTPRNVGSYTITCTGPATIANGNVYYGVTYIPGTLMITQRPITVKAAADTRIYNGTTSSTGTPTISTGSLGTGDTTANFSQLFDSRNVALVGSRTLTPSGVVNDGNTGANYSYIYATTNGTINPKPITVTAASDLKFYDGTPVSSVAPTFPVGSLAAGDTTTNFIQVFDSRNAGSRMLIPSGIVNDGNTGHNYASNFVNNSGTINQRAITVTAATDTKTYDGTKTSPGAPTITTGGLATGDSTTSFSQVFDSPNVGARMLIPSGSVNDLNSGANYAYTFANTAGAINPAPLIANVTGTGPFTVASYTGFVGGDSSALVAGTPPSCTALGTDANSNVTISCSGLSAPNYVVSYSYGATASTSPGILTVFVQGTQTYGGTPGFTPTYSGFVGADTAVSAVTGTLACVTQATSTSAVGTSPAIDSCSGLSSTSYTIAYAYGSVTILPAPLTVIVNSVSPSVTVATPYTGLVNTDSNSVVTGTLACKVNTTADSAGDKPISCSGLTAPSYYAISYSYAAANVVSPAPLTIAVSGTQSGATGTPTFTATYSGFVGGDLPSDIAGTLSCTTVPGPTALTRKISGCSGQSAPVTYTIIYWLGNDTVKP